MPIVIGIAAYSPTKPKEIRAADCSIVGDKPQDISHLWDDSPRSYLSSVQVWTFNLKDMPFRETASGDLSLQHPMSHSWCLAMIQSLIPRDQSIIRAEKGHAVPQMPR